MMFVIAGYVQNASSACRSALLTIGVLINLEEKSASVKDLEPFNKEAARSII